MPAVMVQHVESIQPGCQRQEFLMPWLQSAKMIIPMTHGVSSGRRDLGLLTLLAKPNTRTFWHSGRQLAYFVFLQQRVCKYRKKPLRLHDKSTAVTGKQSRKHKPLVPEYHHIVTLDKSDPAPSNAKQLPPHFSGGRGPRRMSQ